jgi:hypothetical protein
MRNFGLAAGWPLDTEVTRAKSHQCSLKTLSVAADEPAGQGATEVKSMRVPCLVILCMALGVFCSADGTAEERQAPLAGEIPGATPRGAGALSTGGKSFYFEGGEGLSEEAAVKILGAANELEGIQAEHFYIARTHPGWRLRRQHLVHHNKRSFDAIEYDTPDGPRTMWFDITDFFGKGFDELLGKGFGR